MNNMLIQLKYFLHSPFALYFFLALKVDASHFDVAWLFSRCEIGEYQHQRKKSSFNTVLCHLKQHYPLARSQQTPVRTIL